MTIFGIDLGTTYSCIAYVDESNESIVVRNDIGEESTPSVVYFPTKNRAVVGQEAKDAAKSDPTLAVSLIKRYMGVRDVELEFHGVALSPAGVSAFILRDLMRSARAATGQVVKDVVITVPAYFGLAEREATKIAGELAGLNVIAVVPEPVAAALHYGALDHDAQHTVLVYDLGGGTFDTTVIQIDKGSVTVVCTDGDHRLGGADWDGRIASYLQECFVAEFPDSGAAESEEFMQTAGLLAEKVKQALSDRQARRQLLQFEGLKMTAEITRAAFEERTADLLNLTMSITERTLQTAASRDVHSIDKVLLVGGSTIMPAVSRTLRERFGFAPQLHDPHLAVAKGAARFALHESIRIRLADPAGGSGPEQITAIAKEFNVTADAVNDEAERSVAIVVPRAFGVAVVAKGTEPADGKHEIHHLLHANDRLPADLVEEMFHTSRPDQHSVHIEIWEQAGATESRDPADNAKIGQMEITRLPALPKGSPINIAFSMDENGLLHVKAVELVTGKVVVADVQIGDLTPARINEERDAIARLS